MSNQLVLELEGILSVPMQYGRDDFDLKDRTQAAVLVLFRGSSFKESEVLLILRSKTVSRNPGQVAYPGGGIEDSDSGDVIKTALRECEEEVGISNANVQPLGILPALPTVTGSATVEPVLGVYVGEAVPLILDSREVAKAEWVGVGPLLASRKTERRMVHGVEMELPFFSWGQERLWGMSALIFDLILRRYDILFP